jgi:hypothetical protein
MMFKLFSPAAEQETNQCAYAKGNAGGAIGIFPN